MFSVFCGTLRYILRKICVLFTMPSLPRLIPPSLEDLASTELKSYVTTWLHHFIDTPTQDDYPHFKRNQVDPFCEHLDKYLGSALPPGLANQVVNELLNSVNACLYRIQDDMSWFNLGYSQSEENKWSPGCSRHSIAYSFPPRRAPQQTTYIKWCSCVAERISTSIYQPCVTRLVLKKPCFLLNEDMLPKMKQLLELRIEGRYDVKTSHAELLQKCIEQNPDLQIFSYPLCGDDMIQSLASSCSGLKTLKSLESFLTSSHNITDKSIKPLLTFQQLEELHIALDHISASGFDQLCSQLSKNGTKIINLSIVEGRKEILFSKLSLKCFSEVTTLSLCSRYHKYDCSSLKSLNTLKNLTLHTDHIQSFDSVQKVLQHVSEKLQGLVLFNFWKVDLAFVWTHCPNLRSLRIYDGTYSIRYGSQSPTSLAFNYSEQNPLPEMKSIEILGLDTPCIDDILYIISRCVNLKQFRLESHILPRDILNLTVALLEFLKKHTLQEITLMNNISISLQGEKVVVVKYDYEWNQYYKKEYHMDFYANALKQRITQQPPGLFKSNPSQMWPLPTTSFIVNLMWV